MTANFLGRQTGRHRFDSRFFANVARLLREHDKPILFAYGDTVAIMAWDRNSFPRRRGVR